ncbi:MAG: KR domain-containing protein [Marinovum sp.]|nr:KR domain-containing protein [Marinovum sp.]
MALRVPGAQNPEQYWQNLRSGTSSIKKLSSETLKEAGENPGRMAQSNYVPYAAMLDDFAGFDADFFGFSPKEAAILDPQHRQFLEVSWEALETAGHVPDYFDGPIGVYAGCGMGSYFYFNICSNPDLVDQTGMFLLRHTGNDKDFLATRLSHILNLQGPSINLQTACSTSLVATHYAAQALLNGECDMALAGGVTIEMPHARGYLYKENEILSPDGACHAFDHRAQGTVFGSGVGVVVLRRLEDALLDGDHIWAVIKGSAVNNDGAQKAGYLAPSVEGQSAAISEALAVSGVTADSVGYVECHGTGTYLGDPIEVAALTQAFRESTEATNYCRIGSVKTNIGHLDTAAGVASLAKASLALYHEAMPPSLGYEAPNPSIDFETSPFAVNAALTPWPRHGAPRRAGVNSLGVGGTNAHIVLEEAPKFAESETSDWPYHIITVTGRSKAAMETNAARLAEYLRANPDINLADVSFTLEEGRRHFEHRLVTVAGTAAEAAERLASNDPRRVFTHAALEEDPEVVFMFPGGGAQYAGMARDLYETEPVFAEWMDRGLEHLATLTSEDMRALWLPALEDHAKADKRLTQPSLQLPLTMIVEYALAQLWMSWGVEPAALIGHSMGQNAAAAVAGVMSFEDCIGLVHKRGTLFDTVAPGGMLSVALSAKELRPLLPDDIDIGAENAPGLSVASGPKAALGALENELAQREIECQRIAIDIAAHSHLLEPILDDFRTHLRSMSLHAPQIPVISNRSGKMLTDAEACDPDYWVDHLRGMVRFADGIATLAETPVRVFLEVGPGKALTSLARMHPSVPANQVLGTLRHAQDEIEDDAQFLLTLGRLNALGVEIDWEQIWSDIPRRRLPLPTYAFQHQTYFIEPGQARESAEESFLTRSDEIEDWGARIAWVPQVAPCEIDVADNLTDSTPETWLIFEDDAGLARGLGDRLANGGHTVVRIRPGDTFSRLDETDYILSPERGREGYDLLIQDLLSRGIVPGRVAHFWLVTKDESHRPGSSFFHRVQEQGFYALLFLAQALETEGVSDVHITAVTNGAVRARSEELTYPQKSTLSGPLRVIPRELPSVSVAAIDVTLPEQPVKSFFGKSSPRDLSALTDALLEDLLSPPRAYEAALRGPKRYERTVRTMPLAEAEAPKVRDGGAYLVTGGFGGIGLSVAERLVAEGAKHIGLVSRSALPERSAWDRHIADFGPLERISRRIAAVQQLEAQGAAVHVVQADVCNQPAMEKATKDFRQAADGIHGVVHAAGVINDGPLMAKRPAEIEDVFTPKIHGLQVLDALFPDGVLDWMVLFSSTSTVTAPAGQVDYVAANEYLNAYATSRVGSETRVVALNWGIWSDVGMAAESVAARDGDMPEQPRTPTDVPLLDVATFDRDNTRAFEATWDVDALWVLNEHRTRHDNAAILPGTGYIELIAQALRAQGETGAFSVRDLSFLRPLQVSAAKDVRVTLARSKRGYDVAVRSAIMFEGRKAWQLHAEALVLLNAKAKTAQIDLQTVSARMAALSKSDIPIRSAQEGHLAFGPRWSVLRGKVLGEGEGLARVRLPQHATGDLAAGYALHPALMDIATGWGMELIKGYDGATLWVPMRYGRIDVHQMLPEEAISWVRNAAENTATSATAKFDITVFDPDGAVCVEISGFEIKRLDFAGSFGAMPPLSEAELTFDDAGPAAPLSPAELRLRHNLTQGILAHEGSDAFLRALARPESQVVVSSLPIEDLIAQAAAQEEATQLGAAFERPDLDSDYAVPETEIEQTLAGFWSELLGVTQVGIDDSFFDLGGHSLIAVRLFAMVKKTYRVDFPISVLFEAPTIRTCAAMIVERTGIDQTATVASEAPMAEAKPRFRHLVPMHEGEGGSQAPFFLVAGMFGNVLNLRHLAHLLGADRPFFGLQARGLYGGEDPHRSIEEAARDYIFEMRAVQPEGPYYLGGFSGGGITAFEIARQLEAAGQHVGILILLDTPLPVRRPLERRDRILIQLQELRRKGPAYPFKWLKNRIAWEIAKRQGTVENTGDDHAFHNAEIEAAFIAAVNAYQVRPWQGNLHLFRPPLVGHWTVSDGQLVSSERAYLFHDNDWSQFVPGIAVEEVPGDHDSMVLEPHVRVLAASMRRAIEEAEPEELFDEELSKAAE